MRKERERETRSARARERDLVDSAAEAQGGQSQRPTMEATQASECGSPDLNFGLEWVGQGYVVLVCCGWNEKMSIYI